MSDSRLPRTALGACTVVTADYLPWVRVTAGSFVEHHPSGQFAVLCIDEPAPDQLRADDPFIVLRPDQVGLSAAELGWMSLIYTPLELCCALKPWLLRRLLSDTEVAFYIDADMCVYASLLGVADEARRVGLVLSAHALEPRRHPGLPDDDALLQFGQFNGGFMAVGVDGRQFVDWWAERCARECTDWNPAVPRRYLDQRWLDLAIGYFPASVSRDPGINLARWNLFQRDLEFRDGAFLVDGGPLRCFHFSAFDPTDPARMWRHGYTHPRVDPAQSPALQALLEDYADRLLAAGWQRAQNRPPPELAAGIPLTPHLRAAVRTALVDAEQLGVAPSGGPGNEAQLLTWLKAPFTATGLSWFLWGLLRSAPAIAARFPQVPGANEPEYIAWSAAEGVRAGVVPASLAGPASPFTLSGVRNRVVLLEADEVLADPSLLLGLRESFSSEDDVTLLLRAPGFAEDVLLSTVEPTLTAAGLMEPGAVDILAVLDPVPPALLAPCVHAVLTRRDPHAAFTAPVYGTAEALRAAG